MVVTLRSMVRLDVEDGTAANAAAAVVCVCVDTNDDNDNTDDNPPPPNLLLNDTTTITIDFVVRIPLYLFVVLDLPTVTDVHCLSLCLLAIPISTNQICQLQYNTSSTS